MPFLMLIKLARLLFYINKLLHMTKFITLIALLYCAQTTLGQKQRNPLDSLKSCLVGAPNDSSRASIFREIGLLHVNNGNYPKAIEMFLKSKNLFQSIKNEYGIFRCDNILGITYSYMGQNQTAMRYILNAKNGINDGILYNNMGLIYYNSGFLDKSLCSYKKSLDFYRKESDTILIARLLNDIGSIYELQGNIDTAMAYYNECLKTSSDKFSLSSAYASLGDIYFKDGKNYLALEYENKSLKLAEEIGELISVRETEKMLSDIYLKIGDCKASLLHYKKYISIKDSLVNEDNIKQIVRVEETSKFEKERELAKAEQNKKDLIKQEELRHQKNQRNIFISGFIIVLFLSVFLFRAFKRNQKAKIIITRQKDIVDEQKKDILDSIIYASRIQRAILPPDNIIQEILPEHFIFFQPKDSVSGDFYFVDKRDNKIFWASCDATGHSVNGGMLSMLSMNILTEIIKEGEIVPSKILDKLNERFNKSLHKIDDTSVRDGLDITICCLNKNTMELSFSGANNPLWIVKNNIITEYKTDKMPIGQLYKKESYTNHTVKLEKDSTIYSFSDGICDLHSEENKKFMKKRFRELLITIQDKSMIEQKQVISETLNQFKGKAEQVDDMLLIGVKI